MGTESVIGGIRSEFASVMFGMLPERASTMGGMWTTRASGLGGTSTGGVSGITGLDCSCPVDSDGNMIAPAFVTAVRYVSEEMQDAIMHSILKISPGAAHCSLFCMYAKAEFQVICLG